MKNYLLQLWEGQKATGKEQAGFMYPNGYEGYIFNSLPNDLIRSQSATKIEFKIPPDIPEGAIYVHTHPSRTTASAYGISFTNYHRVSGDDFDTIAKMEDKGVAKGFILDEGKIIVYNSQEIITMIDRCGY